MQVVTVESDKAEVSQFLEQFSDAEGIAAQCNLIHARETSEGHWPSVLRGGCIECEQRGAASVRSGAVRVRQCPRGRGQRKAGIGGRSPCPPVVRIAVVAVDQPTGDRRPSRRCPDDQHRCLDGRGSVKTKLAPPSARPRRKTPPRCRRSAAPSRGTAPSTP